MGEASWGRCQLLKKEVEMEVTGLHLSDRNTSAPFVGTPALFVTFTQAVLFVEQCLSDNERCVTVTKAKEVELEIIIDQSLKFSLD